MRREWEDPYSLEPRPKHRPTTTEQYEFEDLLQEIGMIATHLGISVNILYSLPGPKRTKRKAGKRAK